MAPDEWYLVEEGPKIIKIIEVANPWALTTQEDAEFSYTVIGLTS